MNAESHTPCPFEDDVLMVFLDGEPSSDVPTLEDHLASCSRCKVVLDQSRELDATLASRTLVSVSDSKADQYFAFLPEIVTSSARKGWVTPQSRIPWVILVASLLISLGVFVFAKPRAIWLQETTAGESHPRTPSFNTSKSLPGYHAAEAPGVSLGIDVLNLSREPRPRKKPKHWKGTFSFGLRVEAARILRREVGFFRVPNPMIPCGLLAQGKLVIPNHFGPVSSQVESRDSALAWLSLQMGRGHSSLVPLLAQVVQGGSPELGFRVANQLRNQPSAVSHLRKWLRQRRDCSIQAAALLGAVQDDVSIPLLVQRGTPSILEALRTARSIYGPASFPFVFKLWLETQRRDPGLASNLAPSWFEGLESQCFRQGFAILDRTQSNGRGSERNGIRKLFRSLGASSD